MNIAFRVDASVYMGIGHLMRCLTLANAVSNQGANVTFICRALSTQLEKLLVENGHGLLVLSTASRTPAELFGNAKEWLVVSQDEDAKDTIGVLSKTDWNWVVVDHYGLSYEWENRVSLYCNDIMVIDDLANRNHNCGLLLDQTYGRDKTAYNSLVPHSSELLMGSEYMLLRPEFRDYRERSIERRKKPTLENLVISMGGTDPENMSLRVLETLAENRLLEALKTQIIVGSGYQWLKELRRKIEQYTADIAVSVDVSNMAKALSNADLAIGAAGTSTWERCCLGVPTLMVVLADNQQLIAEKASESGAAVNLGKPTSEKFRQTLIKEFSLVRSGMYLSRMSQNALKITDGSGVNTVSKKLMAGG